MPERDRGVGLDTHCIQLHIGGLEGDSAPSRHGVWRVHGQVRENLLDLRWVDFSLSQIGMKHCLMLDILPDQASQQFFNILGVL